MPRDLFGDVTDPSVRVGNRKWYTVPLSLAAHTFALFILVVVPLLATGTLPMPRASMTFVPVTPPPLPAPVVKRADPDTRPRANPGAAPVVAPSTITREPDIDAGFEPGLPGASDVPGAGVIDGVGVLPAPPLIVAPREESAKPVQVGGHIRTPQRVQDVAPVYPAIAQSARIEGIVIIEATIATDGRVQDARVLRSVPMLDHAALAAVRQWVYSPTLLNGVPVSVVMTVTVRFELQ